MNNKYLVGALVVILIGAGWWYLNQSREAPITAADTNVSAAPGMKIYESPDRAFRFSYPESVAVKTASSREVQVVEEVVTVPLPAGSVEIPGFAFVSIVPYTEFSREKPIFDYHSCCSGVRYWYDAAKSEWQANTIAVNAYDSAPLEGESVPLSTDGVCSLRQQFGSRTYYLIKSGDEAIPTDYYYFLLTSNGYAIRVLAPHDLKADYSTYGAEFRPDPAVVAKTSEILASLTLAGGVSEIPASCR